MSEQWMMPWWVTDNDKWRIMATTTNDVPYVSSPNMVSKFIPVPLSRFKVYSSLEGHVEFQMTDSILGIWLDLRFIRARLAIATVWLLYSTFGSKSSPFSVEQFVASPSERNNISVSMLFSIPYVKLSGMMRSPTHLHSYSNNKFTRCRLLSRRWVCRLMPV